MWFWAFSVGFNVVGFSHFLLSVYSSKEIVMVSFECLVGRVRVL